VATEVLVRALIAMRDARTQLITNTLQLLLRAALVAIFLERLDARAIPLAFAVSAAIETCSFQFDPIGKKQFTSSCDIATAALAKTGVPYRIEVAPMTSLAKVVVGDVVIDSYEGAGLSREAAKASADRFAAALEAALAQGGYPKKAAPERINEPMVLAILTLLVVYVTMVYGPIAAWLVELFPTRIRYTSMSLPYHIGNGWFGGFLPTISFALVAATGDMYYGLWYPIAVAAMTFVVGSLFLHETKDVDLTR